MQMRLTRLQRNRKMAEDERTKPPCLETGLVDLVSKWRWDEHI